MRCFHARTNAHILHLKTQSYAQHVALNEFYDGIIPLADKFAESYIGAHGLIDEYNGRYSPRSTSLAAVKELTDWIEKNRMEVCEHSTCQNIIDEILALGYSTIYKLKFLK